MKNSIYIFLFFLSLYVLSMGGHGYGGVGTTTYEVTRAMLLKQSVAISEVPWGKFGADGQFYAQYGIGHSLYNVPFYALGHVLVHLFPRLAPQYNRITMFTTLLGQPCISALTCVLLFCFCLKSGYSRKIALSCTFFYGLGTQAWMYAQLDFSEPILTFLLLGAVYWIYVPEKTCEISKTSQVWSLLLSGLFLGIAVTVKIVALLLLPIFIGYVWFTLAQNSSRLEKMLLFIIPAVGVGIGIVGVYNAFRFGNPLETGYDNEFTWYAKDILRHFGENLWGLEGSVFLYSPIIFLAFSGIKKFYKIFTSFAVFLYGIILTLFLFYPFTTNELYYGPRYLTPTLPFFMLIAGVTLAKVQQPSQGFVRKKPQKWGIRILLVLGILQQILGVVVNYHTYYWRIQYTLPVVDDIIRFSEIGERLLSTPYLPHILGHIWLVKHAVLDAFTPGGLPLSGVELLSDPFRHNAWVPYYGIDLWWCHRKFVAMAGWVGPILIVGILISVMSFSLDQVFKE